MTDQTTTDQTTDTAADAFDLTTLPRTLRPAVAARIQERRDALRNLMVRLHRVPTLRQVKPLMLELGFKASIGTLCVDYQALGLSSTRRPG